MNFHTVTHIFHWKFFVSSKSHAVNFFMNVSHSKQISANGIRINVNSGNDSEPFGVLIESKIMLNLSHSLTMIRKIELHSIAQQTNHNDRQARIREGGRGGGPGGLDPLLLPTIRRKLLWNLYKNP